jgi:hypothetical protein
MAKPTLAATAVAMANDLILNTIKVLPERVRRRESRDG